MQSLQPIDSLPEPSQLDTIELDPLPRSSDTELRGADILSTTSSQRWRGTVVAMADMRQYCISTSRNDSITRDDIDTNQYVRGIHKYSR